MLPEIVKIDIFNLAKYGSLKLKERKWFNDRQVQQAKYAIKLAQIAHTFALEHDIEPLEAFDIVSNPQIGDVRLVPYAAQLGEIPNAIEREMNGTGEAITMFLQSRLPADFLTNNSQILKQQYGIDIEPALGWQHSYTEELPESTIEEILEFLNGETTRWLPSTDNADTSEDTLGNASSDGEKPSTPTTTNTVPTATGASS